MLRRAVLALPLATPLVLALAAPAAAQPQRAPDADATWRARLSCDPMPPLTSRRLRVNFLLTVSGGVARYERAPLGPEDGPQGLVERGEGRVGRDGALTLEGIGTGPGVRYTARYAGRLSADGLGNLNGRQQWPAGSPAGERPRPCSIKLWRQ